MIQPEKFNLLKSQLEGDVFVDNVQHLVEHGGLGTRGSREGSRLAENATRSDRAGRRNQENLQRPREGFYFAHELLC